MSSKMVFSRHWKHFRFDRMRNRVQILGSTEKKEIQGTNPWYSDLFHQVSLYGVATGYCISASLLSIINKWAIMKFPHPGALTALQYCTSAFGVLLCGQLKLIELDPLNLLTMWRFLPAAIIFYLSLFTNSELLLHSNVDTFIVFRSAVPVFVAIGETLFLNQPWPSFKTWISLVTIFGGSLLYVLTDFQFIQSQHIAGLLRILGISATGFTVLGIVNKLLTVVINLVILDKHSTFIGTLGLLICMFGGVMYQQSTGKKPQVQDEEQKKLEDNEEAQKLCTHEAT